MSPLFFSAALGLALASPPRDPFTPLVTTPPTQRGRLGSQAWPVLEHTLLGLIAEESGPDRSGPDKSGAHALVQDPTGQTWVLAEGDYLGDAWGRVVQVGNGQVVVEEELLDGLGRLFVEQRVLALPVVEAGMPVSRLAVEHAGHACAEDSADP
jgi:hypothetical protein